MCQRGNRDPIGSSLPQLLLAQESQEPPGSLRITLSCCGRSLRNVTKDLPHVSEKLLVIRIVHRLCCKITRRFPCDIADHLFGNQQDLSPECPMLLGIGIILTPWLCTEAAERTLHLAAARYLEGKRKIINIVMPSHLAVFHSAPIPHHLCVLPYRPRRILLRPHPHLQIFRNQSITFRLFPRKRIPLTLFGGAAPG